MSEKHSHGPGCIVAILVGGVTLVLVLWGLIMMFVRTGPP